jgi:hypothetical protein
MNLNHVWKKVGRGRIHNLFSFNVFLNLHALGYPKSVTIFCFMGFGLKTVVPQPDVARRQTSQLDEK